MLLQTLTPESAAFLGVPVASRGLGHVPNYCSFLQDNFVLKQLWSKVTLGAHDALDLDP